MAGQETQVGFVPMDNNVGMSNRLEKIDMERMMQDTLSDLAEVLKDHCGPYGKYAAITSPVNPSAEPIFTKDGINIVRSIDYVSQVQQFIKHTLMYMGSRVESSVGDGTTSAMIIMAEAMRILIQQLKHIPCTYQELVDAYSTVVSHMEKDYRPSFGHTVDDRDYKDVRDTTKFIHYVAYSQAYTSSHGDIELSKIIADLFASTPKEVWRLFSINKTSYETKERYVIDTEKCQWKIEECQLFPLTQMTEEFGTASVRKNVRTIITDRGIAVGDAYTEPVRNAISEACEKSEPLTVVVTGNLDTATNMWLSELFQKYPDHRISIFMVTPGDYGMWNDLPYIKVATGKQPEAVMELNLSYKFNGRDLVITSGIYEDSDNKTCHLHPYYKNNDYPIYNEFVNRLEHQIEVQSSTVATRESNNILAHMRKMLSKLIVVNRNYFRIGGAAYDNAATVDVAVDVLTAVKNSLTNGFVFGSNKSLYKFFKDVKYRKSLDLADHDKHKDELIRAIAHAFECAIESTFVSMFRFTRPISYKKMMRYLNDELPFNILNPELPGYVKDIYDMCFDDQESEQPYEYPAVIQPIDTDFAIVKRFGEVALRFVKTARLISEGGIYINNKKAQ